MKKIAILASGTGSNAENIARHFAGSSDIMVDLLLTDRSEAPVVEKMKLLGVETMCFPRTEWCADGGFRISELLEKRDIDLVVLAGFTSIVGDAIIRSFDRRIVNLHPSLLPKFGGKGMWGMNVHRAVIAAGEKESGISFHYVSPVVDGGEIIAQFRCPVAANDTPETLVAKIHALEHRHYPAVIESLLRSEGKVE